MDRELSWLDFNRRVLHQSTDPVLPLLERVRFLAIHAANMDEFFQLRVSGIHETVKAGVSRRSTDGPTPIELLKKIRESAGEQLRFAADLFAEELRPAMVAEGILIAEADSLDYSAREWISQQFVEQIFPVLTPMAFDLAHPFPYISDLSLNLAVHVSQERDTSTQEQRTPTEKQGTSTQEQRTPTEKQGTSLWFARIKVPPILPRFTQLPDGTTFVALETIIAAHLAEIFPGINVIRHSMFRVTRDADVEIDDTDDTDDLMKQLEYELSQRRFGEAVRLEVADSLGDDDLEMLTRELGLSQDAVITVPGLLGLADLAELHKIDRPDLKFERHIVRKTAALETDSTDPSELFSTLAKRDVLLHFPYESFTESVAAFIRTAARDPAVLAIKMTMYRTSERTQLVDWLIEAAKLGKQVVVVVELKARFDEQANIEWARQLERSGVHVSYGLAGLKTHCKIALVVRREGRGGREIRRYTHVGTGNYNADTARHYEDLGLLSSDESIADDVSQLFNTLTGYSRYTGYKKMLVAPHSLSREFGELIADQASRADGHIFLKVNALVDSKFIDSLYEASQQGCEIDLVVRGICCLVPGQAGLSENIRVRSIIGRFLEHSRIYRFGYGGDDDTFMIGSPDPMPRNLRHRVESLIPVTDEHCKTQLIKLCDAYMADDIERWELQATGQWHHIKGASLHQRLIERSELTAT